MTSLHHATSATADDAADEGAIPDQRGLVDHWRELAARRAADREYDAALEALGQARDLLGRGGSAAAIDDQEAGVLHLRYLDVEDPGVRATTLARLDQLCAQARPSPFALLCAGQILMQRSTETGDAAGLDEAVRRLDAAAAMLPDTHQGLAWAALGLTLLVRAAGGAAHDRDRAIASMERALTAGWPDPAGRAPVITHLAAAYVDALAAAPSPSTVAAAAAALESGAAELATAPTDDLDTDASLAMQLARLEMVLFGRAEHRHDPERLAEHVGLARRHPDPPAEWAAQLVAIEAHLQAAAFVRTGAAGGSLHQHLAALLASGALPAAAHEQLGHMFATTTLHTASLSGDLGGFRDAARLSAHRSTPDARQAAALAELAMLHAQGASPGELLAALDRVIDACQDAAATQPEDRWGAEFLLPGLLTMREALAPTGRPLPDPSTRALSGPLADMLGGLLDRVADIANVSAATDPEQRRGAVLRLERQTADAAGQERSIGAHRLVTEWSELSGGGDDRDAVERAIRWGEEALRLDGGPEHPHWIQAARNTALAYRLRGTPADRLRSRELGVAVLRGHAWLALAQAGAADAMTTARDAAVEAVRVARWCVDDRDDDRLVAALDAGRGLALQAAVTARGVADLLRTAGEPGLAAAWTRAGGSDRIMTPDGAQVQGDLRRRALAALGAVVADPPSVHQIRAALVAHGSDALVYLVPADVRQPGLAVVVPVREPVEVVELPELDVVAATRLADRAQPDAGRDIAPAREASGGGLVELLDWAWRVGGRPLAEVADRLRGSDGEEARLVLVPFGALARVPWHAAGPISGERGLLDHAVVSTTPSARMLCQAVTRPARTGGGRLVVGNPTGDLRGAGAEARAIVDVFYPDADYLGPADDRCRSAGTGLAAEVTARLADDAEPLALLHLACHGHADPTAPGRSRLVLEDRAIDVDELLGLRPAAQLDIGTVCLAACSTNVSGTNYDEAFSLASAFLAAGARTAFASMWRVSDDHTSQLMFMVHHHLAEGYAPADALHRARLWARDPRRVPPSSMPAALSAGVEGMTDPVAWAGFQHLGA